MVISIIWGSALILFLIFCSWYIGFNKPVTQQEIDEIKIFLKQGGKSEEEINIFTQFFEKDDGKEFLMVNIMELKQPLNQSAKNLMTYSKGFLGMLIKMAGHPIFAGKAAGGYLENINMPAQNWHSVFIVRYRCRRDFLKIIKLAFGQVHNYKIISLEKTFAQPVTVMANPFNGSKSVALLLALMAAIAHIIVIS
jgi:hypothetical protein